MRDYRKMCKKKHLCVTCCTKDDFTMGGSLYCEACTEKRRLSNKSYRDRNRELIAEKEKTRREERKAAGLCPLCGKQAMENHVHCIDCTLRNRNRQKKKREAAGSLSRQLFRELGLCTKCGAQRVNRLTAWGGNPVQLCERCYHDSVRACEAGRTAYKEKNRETWGQTEFNRYQKKNGSGSSAKSSLQSTS